MKDLREKVSRLQANLDGAIRVEQDLAGKLASQESALMSGAIEEIHTANRALDRVYEELREVARGCTQAVAELYTDLGLVLGSPLRKLIERLPADLAPELRAQSGRLREARSAARHQSTRNATIARTSLDAIASVRGILSRATDDPDARSYTRSSLSRLDAQA